MRLPGFVAARTPLWIRTGAFAISMNLTGDESQPCRRWSTEDDEAARMAGYRPRVPGPLMDFDLFYELAVPAFTGRTEQQVYDDTLAEIALADKLDFGVAWLTEHHFMPEYSHSAAPDVFLAAAAQRTTRLRLGHAVIALPYHHPLQVAERAATLDILSGGRLEIGLGRGFSPKEYATFGIRSDDSRARVDEGLQILRLALTDSGPISFHGQHFDFADIMVRPRPLQAPHPPLWMAAVSPESFEIAARLGIGVLAGPFKPWFMVREDIRRYRAAFAREHGQSTAYQPQVAMTIGVVCLDDHAAARSAARTSMTWFYRELLRLTMPILTELQAGYEYYQKFGSLQAILKRSISLPILEHLGMVVAGNPEHCRRKLAAYANAGVDRLLCAIGAGAIPTTLARTIMTTLNRDVLPAFRPCRYS